ncbi:MAG: hypothetical protein ABW024_09345 [Microbacterium sp.]
MKRWAQWTIGVGLVVAAWFVAAATPPEESREAPFVVAVGVGERGEGRNIAVLVEDVARAASVEADGWSAEGNWLVADLEVSSVEKEFGVLLSRATFEIDGITYGASERPSSLLRTSLFAGVPQSGSLAFELPADLVSGDGVLRFGVDTDERLDSVIEVAVDLDGIPVEDTAELRPTEWSGR